MFEWGIYIYLGIMMIRRWLLMSRILIDGLLSRTLFDVSKVGIIVACVVEMVVLETLFCIAEEEM